MAVLSRLDSARPNPKTSTSCRPPEYQPRYRVEYEAGVSNMRKPCAIGGVQSSPRGPAGRQALYRRAIYVYDHCEVPHTTTSDTWKGGNMGARKADSRGSRFTVSLPNALMHTLDRLQSGRRYANRSEFVRDMLRAELVKEEWQEQTGESVGVLVLVYDHDTRALAVSLSASARVSWS